MPIERATQGAVTRRDLRSDDYLIHWPELATPLSLTPPVDTDLNQAMNEAAKAGLIERRKIIRRAEDRALREASKTAKAT